MRIPTANSIGQLPTVGGVAKIYRKRSLAAAPNQVPTSAIVSSRIASVLDPAKILAVRD